MSDLFVREKTDRLLSRLGELHTSPQVAKRVLALTADVDFDIRKVVECIETDPALAAKILRIVHSPRYGIRQNVTSLRHAVTILGQRSLRLTTMTFSLVLGLTRGAAGRAYRAYWRDALSVAVFAERLAGAVAAAPADEAYAGGLLADVGVLALLQAEEAAYAVVRAREWRGGRLVQAERLAFGFDHAILGARLLERWEFGDDIVAAVGRHHDEETSTLPELGSIVNAAARLVDSLRSASDADFQVVRAQLGARFGLNTDDLIDLVLGSREEIARQAEIFGVELDEPVDCEALLDRARRLHQDAALETALDLDSISSVVKDTSV